MSFWFFSSTGMGLMDDDWYCIFPILGDFMYIAAAVTVYVARTWLLLFQFEYAHERVALASKAQTSTWFTDHKHWMKTENVMKMSVVIFIVLFLPYIYIIWSLSSLAQTMHSCPQRDVSVMYTNIIQGLSIIVFGILIYNLKRQFDFFWLRSELKRVLISAIFIFAFFILIDVIPSLEHIDKSIWRISEIVAALFVFMCIIVSTIMPLRLSYTMNAGQYHNKSTMTTTVSVEATGNSRENSKEDGMETELLKVLDDSQGRVLFKKFLIGEFSVENLLFYEAVEIWQNKSGTATEAKEIAELFISNNGVMSLNLSPLSRQTTMVDIANLRDGDKLPGDIREIIRLMKNDSFRRFRNTAMFREFKAGNSVSVGDLLKEIGINANAGANKMLL